MASDRSSTLAGTPPKTSAFSLAPIELLRAARSLLAQTHIRWLSAIVLLAFALRLAFVIAVQPNPGDPGRFDDTVYYDASARSLADGHGYAIPRPISYVQPGHVDLPSDAQVLVETARWPPGYSMVLAAIYVVFGHAVMLARLLNVVLGTATVLLIYLLGCRLADRRVGLLGALLFAVYPSHIMYSTLLLTEVPFTFLLIGILLLSLAWGERGASSLRKTLALGVIVGLAAMVRGEAMLLPLAIALAWAIDWRSLPRGALHGAVMMAGLALVFVPWTVRNAIQLDSPIIGTTGAGGALIQAHHPGANGKPDLFVEVQYESRYRDVPYPKREIELYNVYVDDALRYIREHPGREVQLVGLRARAMFDRDDSAVAWLRLNPAVIGQRASDVLTSLSQTHYLIVTILAGLCAPLWLSLRRPANALLAIVTAYYVGTHVLMFIGEGRYHVPLMAIIGLWAAIGLVFVWDQRPGARRASAA